MVYRYRMLTRPIPSSGQPLPVVGCGTWRGFDMGSQPELYPGRAAVLEALWAEGGRVIDSSPMYGTSEQVVGDLLDQGASHGKAFLATKVWTRGRREGLAQMERSLALLRSPTIDLMQVHNLLDWQVHLPTLRDWKAQGRIRYLGVTHYTGSAHDELEQVMRSEPLDFVQLNYALTDRAAARRLLPLAAQRGMAVLVNLPLGGGAALQRLRARPLPGWAGDIGCATWNQVMLKFVLSHPAVTCVIPGTSSAAHMHDNAQAASGEIPPLSFWTTARLQDCGVA
ncbi:MAG: aldo/keto reductase [Ramlibacter sp.]|nr:aldo/keto reductase [Ramlibacter sp.]